MSMLADGVRECLLRRKPQQVQISYTDGTMSDYLELVEALDNAVLVGWHGCQFIIPLNAIQKMELK